MTLYTSKVIAQWLCLTERRVRQLRDEGVIVEARPGLYELQPTVARYIKYLGGAGKESLNTERMKLTAEKRKAAEMDNDLRRGDLHSTQDIEKGIQTMCLNIRSRFLAMDLAKKTYSTTPDYFIAGTTVGIVTAAKEASAAIAAHNLVLLDGGKVKPLAAVDGSNALNVTGLYGIAAEDAASGEDAVVYLTGEFFADGLALPDGVAAADIEVALRNIGIFLK